MNKKNILLMHKIMENNLVVRKRSERKQKAAIQQIIEQIAEQRDEQKKHAATIRKKVGNKEKKLHTKLTQPTPYSRDGRPRVQGNKGVFLEHFVRVGNGPRANKKYVVSNLNKVFSKAAADALQARNARQRYGRNMYKLRKMRRAMEKGEPYTSPQKKNANQKFREGILKRMGEGPYKLQGQIVRPDQYMRERLRRRKMRELKKHITYLGKIMNMVNQQREMLPPGYPVSEELLKKASAAEYLKRQLNRKMKDLEKRTPVVVRAPSPVGLPMVVRTPSPVELPMLPAPVKRRTTTNRGSPRVTRARAAEMRPRTRARTARKRAA
tara:strand:+ start:4195 stop:5166 length:972 start_codon:yes stop_codon:yes gene_type:complete